MMHMIKKKKKTKGFGSSEEAQVILLASWVTRYRERGGGHIGKAIPTGMKLLVHSSVCLLMLAPRVAGQIIVKIKSGRDGVKFVVTFPTSNWLVVELKCVVILY